MNFLVVEDDLPVQTLLKIILEKKEHEVVLAKTVKRGTALALEGLYDMIILDLGLPNEKGYNICKFFHEHKPATPILVLSAEKDTDVKVKCLNLGADDYLTKPFDTSELFARIDAIIRRTNGMQNKKTITCGELKVNLMDRTFAVNDTEIELTNNEFNLLVYLMRHKNETISQDEIAENVWDIHFDTQTNYINVYISYLRKKIRAHAEHKYIDTVRKKGFAIHYPRKNS